MDLKKVYHDMDGNVRNIRQMVILEPEWAANRIQEGEKAIERVKLLEKAICIYSCECINIDFDNDKDALDSFELWAEDDVGYVKVKCDKCLDTKEIWYYHDAGDHFGGGNAPGSEWRKRPCECVGD